MEIAKYISVMLASMLKFFGGPIAGFLTGLPIQKTIFLSAGGMVLAVLATTIFAKAINKYLESRQKNTQTHFHKTEPICRKNLAKIGPFWHCITYTPTFYAHWRHFNGAFFQSQYSENGWLYGGFVPYLGLFGKLGHL